MKTELKISTLSIACVLCAAFSAPAFSAPAVRALGGVGTYSSASNAASAKATGADAGGSAISAVRGNTRVGGAASSTDGVVTSTRTSAVPRLSIGKYLAGSASLGGAASGTTKPGQSGAGNGNLQERIRILEQHFGYKGDGSYDSGRIEAAELNIEKLKSDVALLTAGAVSDVLYDAGILTVYKIVDGKEVKTEYDLNKEFAGVSALAALEEKINQVVLDNYVTRDELTGYALATDLDSAVAQLTATDGQLQAAIDALNDMGDSASAAELVAVKADVEKLLVSDKKNADDILALQTTVTSLSSDNMIVKDAVKKLESSLGAFLTVDDLANYYTKSEVDGLIKTADNFNSNLYYTKDEVNGLIPTVPTVVSAFENDADYVTAAALKATDDVAKAAQNMADLNATEIATLKSETTKYAAKTELESAKAELKQQILDITGGTGLGALAYKDTVATDDIDDDSVTADKINTNVLNGGMAIVKNTADGTEFIPVVIIDADGNEI